jgi:hypothetical protein
MVSRLDLSRFMERDDLQSPVNTYAGNISIELAFGNLAESPIYYLPFGELVSIGGIVIELLVLKSVLKRRKTS